MNKEILIYCTELVTVTDLPAVIGPLIVEYADVLFSCLLRHIKTVIVPKDVATRIFSAGLWSTYLDQYAAKLWSNYLRVPDTALNLEWDNYHEPRKLWGDDEKVQGLHFDYVVVDHSQTFPDVVDFILSASACVPKLRAMFFPLTWSAFGVHFDFVESITTLSRYIEMLWISVSLNIVLSQFSKDGYTVSKAKIVDVLITGIVHRIGEGSHIVIDLEIPASKRLYEPHYHNIDLSFDRSLLVRFIYI